MNKTEWITIKEATRILGISERTLWRRVKAGKYQTRREGGGEKALRLLSRKDIERDLKRSVSLPAPVREDKTIQLVSEFQNVIRRHTDKIMAGTDKQADKRHKRLFRNILLLLIVITILLLTFVYLTVTRESGRSERRLSDKIQTMADRQEARNNGQEALKTAIKNDLTQAGEKIRDLEASNQATGEKINQQRKDITETGELVKGQAAKIDRQTAEIEGLQKQVSNQNTAIISLMDAIRELIEIKSAPPATPIPTITPGPRPTIEPVKTPAPVTTPEPPAQEEKGGGFLGIF